jgi:hypothetical protein
MLMDVERHLVIRRVRLRVERRLLRLRDHHLLSDAVQMPEHRV